MKLYYSKGACSLVVRIIINEIGLPCDYESVDLKTKKTETGKDFFNINAKGSVPVLQLDNGKILTENAVILQYIADTARASSLLPNIGEWDRYCVLEWLNYITTELHKGFGSLFNNAIAQDVKEQIFIPLIKAKLTFVNNHLEHHAYLVGNHFTLPDAYLFVILRWAIYFKLNLNDWPNLASYSTELSKRPAIQQSLKEER